MNTYQMLLLVCIYAWLGYKAYKQYIRLCPCDEGFDWWIGGFAVATIYVLAAVFTYLEGVL
jgi:hypothetical protein